MLYYYTNLQNHLTWDISSWSAIYKGSICYLSLLKS